MTKGAINSALSLALRTNDKPLAIIVAGHNGSGKSTLWYEHVADHIKIPLINADRMMLSILPEASGPRKRLPKWAQDLRDKNELWMSVAQQGVQAFVAQAMGGGAAFAMETVFSHWVEHPDGRIESKIDTIRDLQKAGYFVLLMFVGLANVDLSIGRVQTRRSEGGHDVAFRKLLERFPRTQLAVHRALDVADAAILFDNSRATSSAFTVVHVRTKGGVAYDIRSVLKRKPKAITAWLDKVAPV